MNELAKIIKNEEIRKEAEEIGLIDREGKPRFGAYSLEKEEFEKIKKFVETYKCGFISSDDNGAYVLYSEGKEGNSYITRFRK